MASLVVLILAIICTTSIIAIANSICRFGDVAELVECTSLDIYARLPAAELTPATTYAAYLVYGVAEGHRGLSYPDQETTVALGGGRVAPARHAVCLHPTRPRRASSGPCPAAPATRSRGGRGCGRTGGRKWRWRRRRRREAPATVAGEEVAVSFEVLG